MSGQHTPGPWVVGRDVIGTRGEQGFTRHIVEKLWEDEQGEADARLYTAAPDLLEALRKAEDAMNYMGDILNGMDAVLPEDVAATTEAFEAVSAAIAKAEGRS